MKYEEQIPRPAYINLVHIDVRLHLICSSSNVEIYLQPSKLLSYTSNLQFRQTTTAQQLEHTLFPRTKILAARAVTRSPDGAA